MNLVDQKYNKERNIVKYYYNLKYMFSNLVYCKIEFIPMITEAEFSAAMHHLSLVSHDSSEIILIAAFLII